MTQHFSLALNVACHATDQAEDVLNAAAAIYTDAVKGAWHSAGYGYKGNSLHEVKVRARVDLIIACRAYSTAQDNENKIRAELEKS